MRDLNFDWCFEGGCTYGTEVGVRLEDEVDTTELEAMYGEPCIGMFD